MSLLEPRMKITRADATALLAKLGGKTAPIYPFYMTCRARLTATSPPHYSCFVPGEFWGYKRTERSGRQALSGALLSLVRQFPLVIAKPLS